MLIVFSHPEIFKCETEIVNELFKEGLEIFHLKKNNATLDEVRTFVDKIDHCHHPKIAFHKYHQIVDEVGSKRWHISEMERMKFNNFFELKEKGYCLTTSIHEISVIHSLPVQFDYVFYGPVFDSISKKGYLGHPNLQQFELPKTDALLVAIGGIEENNLEQTLNLGFKNIAILGAIWQNKNPIKNFKQIQNKWLKLAQLY